MSRGNCRVWWSSGYFRAYAIGGDGVEEIGVERIENADEAPWQWELSLDDDEMGEKLGGCAATQQDALAELQLASLIEMERPA